MIKTINKFKTYGHEVYLHHETSTNGRLITDVYRVTVKALKHGEMEHIKREDFNSEVEAKLQFKDDVRNAILCERERLYEYVEEYDIPGITIVKGV